MQHAPNRLNSFVLWGKGEGVWTFWDFDVSNVFPTSSQYVHIMFTMCFSPSSQYVHNVFPTKFSICSHHEHVFNVCDGQRKSYYKTKEIELSNVALGQLISTTNNRHSHDHNLVMM